MTHSLKVGLYYSLMEWNNPMLANNSLPYGVKDKANYPYTGLKKVNDYVNDFMIPQIKELIDFFHPDFFFFGGEWDKPKTFRKMKEIIAYFTIIDNYFLFLFYSWLCFSTHYFNNSH